MKKLWAAVLTLCLVFIATPALAYELREPIGDYPLTTEDITLTIMIQQDTLVEDYETNQFTLWIEEMTGVDLEFELLPANAAEALNKLSVMCASGQELPDIVNIGISLADLEAIAPSGAFIPLDDYIGTITPNLDLACETFASDNLLKYATSSDGHIYGLPALRSGIHDQVAKKLVMNTTWLENLGSTFPRLPTNSMKF